MYMEPVSTNCIEVGPRISELDSWWEVFESAENVGYASAPVPLLVNVQRPGTP